MPSITDFIGDKKDRRDDEGTKKVSRKVDNDRMESSFTPTVLNDLRLEEMREFNGVRRFLLKHTTTGILLSVTGKDEREAIRRASEILEKLL